MSQEQDLDWLRQLGDLVCRRSTAMPVGSGSPDAWGVEMTRFGGRVNAWRNAIEPNWWSWRPGGSHLTDRGKKLYSLRRNWNGSEPPVLPANARTHHGGDGPGTRASAANGLEVSIRPGEIRHKYDSILDHRKSARTSIAELQPLGSG